MEVKERYRMKVEGMVFVSNMKESGMNVEGE